MQLYDLFLKIVDEVCKGGARASSGPHDHDATTERLRDEPTRIPKLSHASDDDLLLKRRIENLLTRVAPAMREEEP